MRPDIIEQKAVAADAAGRLRMTRRRCLAGLTAAVLAGCATTPYTYTARITRRVLWLPRLPRAWDGVVALHLSDFHRGPLVPEWYLRGVISRARTLPHDIAFFTGDFVSIHRDYIKEVCAWLRDWPAPLGAYAVLGNHDHYTDPVLVTRSLEKIRVAVLNNRATEVSREGSTISIIGVDDPATSHNDLKAAMRGVTPGGFRILLGHSPDIVWHVQEREIDLTLCGHTHGGQVCLPGGQALVCPVNLGVDYAQGVFVWRKGLLFVNRGLGVVGFPLRTFCPPEIALLELRRGKQR